jgi:preprotein translocase subunit SecA
MRNFGAADRMTKIMERFGLEEGQELEHPWLTKSVETAQKRWNNAIIWPGNGRSNRDLVPHDAAVRASAHHREQIDAARSAAGKQPSTAVKCRWTAIKGDCLLWLSANHLQISDSQRSQDETQKGSARV